MLINFNLCRFWAIRWRSSVLLTAFSLTVSWVCNHKYWNLWNHLLASASGWLGLSEAWCLSWFVLQVAVVLFTCWNTGRIDIGILSSYSLHMFWCQELLPAHFLLSFQFYMQGINQLLVWYLIVAQNIQCQSYLLLLSKNSKLHNCSSTQTKYSSHMSHIEILYKIKNCYHTTLKRFLPWVQT